MTNLRILLVVAVSLALGMLIYSFWVGKNTYEYANPIVSQSLVDVTEQTYRFIEKTAENMGIPQPSNPDLNNEQKRRTEQLISVFENDTTEIQYDMIENIGDGRGYTAGKAGFTTRYEDFYMVVKAYDQKKPGNPLSKYLPRLKELKEDGSDSTSGLSGIKDAWIKSSEDPVFRKVQDDITDELYYNPAMNTASELGIKKAITKAFIYDTIIQHGNGNDKDSLTSIINRTNSKMGGSPKDGINEIDWLYKMIEIRKNVLKNPDNDETQDEWSESTDRCDIFKAIVDSENLDLEKKIVVNSPNHKAIIE